jgi:hypothetical protein
MNENEHRLAGYGNFSPPIEKMAARRWVTTE